jgi:PucR family transcriptional regulator, purine catabolism regulatory protein
VPDRHAALLLGDLLAQEDLGLELLSGGEQARGRPVAGAHSIEVEAPTRFLAEDWVMLTTGIRLRGDTRAQRALVAELDAAGVAAIGFGTGLVFKRVPAALLGEARARSFPVFAVPFATPFRDVAAFVHRSVLSRDLRAFQRLTSIQRYLLDALQEQAPRRTVIERLAQVVDATTFLLGPDGEVELATGAAPIDAIWAKIAARPGVALEFDSEGWQAVACPVASASPAPDRWLVVASPRPGFVPRLAKAAAQATAPLLTAIARLGEQDAAHARAMRGALLDDALGPAASSEASSLEARAATFGIDFGEPARLAAIQTSSGPPSPALRADLERRLDAARLPHLVTARGAVLLALVQCAGPPLRAALDGLLETHDDVVAGIGRPIRAIADCPLSLRDAEIALERARRDEHGRLLGYEDFDLAAMVVSEAPSDRIAGKVDELVGRLRARPLLHAAVLAYLEHALEVTAAARAMHLHPNTLRYRLARAEELLGGSLRQPATIASLYIALLASAGVPDAAPARRGRGRAYGSRR